MRTSLLTILTFAITASLYANDTTLCGLKWKVVHNSARKSHRVELLITNPTDKPVFVVSYPQAGFDDSTAHRIPPRGKLLFENNKVVKNLEKASVSTRTAGIQGKDAIYIVSIDSAYDNKVLVRWVTLDSRGMRTISYTYHINDPATFNQLPDRWRKDL